MIMVHYCSYLFRSRKYQNKENLRTSCTEISAGGNFTRQVIHILTLDDPYWHGCPDRRSVGPEYRTDAFWFGPKLFDMNRSVFIGHLVMKNESCHSIISQSDWLQHHTMVRASCYEEISLPMDFGWLPLQSYCDDEYSLIVMNHDSWFMVHMIEEW